MTQERKPDWEWWGKVDEVTVIEAVALSMDIDPNKLHYRKPPGTMGVVEVRDESPEFDKRFSLAIRNLKVLEARGRYDVDELENCSMKLVKFTAVALSWNWKIPPEMAALAEPDKRDAKILEWPWGSRETKLLGHLAEAAKELWCRYDPTDATTAPTNIQVHDFLIKRNVSKRVAEVIAQILRADELPSGNHKR